MVARRPDDPSPSYSPRRQMAEPSWSPLDAWTLPNSAHSKRERHLKKRKTIEELRDYYDTHDLSGDIKKAKLVTEPPEELLISTSIRLPKPLMDAVRARAAEAGVPYTTLIRQWVLDRLDNDEIGISLHDLGGSVYRRLSWVIGAELPQVTAVSV